MCLNPRSLQGSWICLPACLSACDTRRSGLGLEVGVWHACMQAAVKVMEDVSLHVCMCMRHGSGQQERYEFSRVHSEISTEQSGYHFAHRAYICLLRATRSSHRSAVICQSAYCLHVASSLCIHPSVHPRHTYPSIDRQTGRQRVSLSEASKGKKR